MNFCDVAKAIADHHLRPALLEEDISDALHEMFATTKAATIETINGLVLPTDMRDSLVQAVGAMRIPELADWKAEPDEDESEGEA